MNTNQRDRIVGCLLGGAVGDAIGLPAEGLTAQRQRRLFGTIDRHRLLFGRGLLSDDTEHALLTAQALIESGGADDAFERALARRLRLWFLAVSPGIGLATARACLKLCVGVPPKRCGVRSAGNGPAMRAAILGAFCAGDADGSRLDALVARSTRLTHTDPKAAAGARRVAYLAAGWADPTPGTEVGEVSGYIVATVAAAEQACAAHPVDLRAAVVSVVARGGDTDSVAAVVGGVLGARLGPDAVPADWLAGLAEPLWTPARIAALGDDLARAAAPHRADGPPFALLLARNVAALAIVLAHGFRRLAPPY